MALVLLIKLFRDPIMEIVAVLNKFLQQFKIISSEKVSIKMREGDNECIHMQLLAPFFQLHIHALLIWEEKKPLV